MLIRKYAKFSMKNVRKSNVNKAKQKFDEIIQIKLQKQTIFLSFLKLK